MSFLNELNSKQQEAVKTVEGPVMVVAGPGSGKTRVLTYRIAYLISIGVPAYRILALTFTNKAASEMKERIHKLVGEKSRQLWMGTFHSVFARILRVECEKLEYQKNFSIYDETDSLSMIKTCMESLSISSQQYHPRAIRSRISSAKNQLISVQEYADRSLDIFEQKTSAVYSDYQKRLKQNNAMDFDDLLLKPLELFKSDKKVLDKYHEYFRFILVDEYQDTNRVQYALINSLASKYKNICVVGDDAQSIYAFRGADIKNILDFRRDYPEVTTFRLEQNYRSTTTILSAADYLIKHNVDQISKNLWTDNPAGDAITVLSCEDDRDEGARIVSQIFEQSNKLKIDLKDIAITYRTNAQSRSLEEALRKNSIPYVIVGGIEFYQRKEVKDTLAYLRLLVNPQDNEGFLRIANYPTRGLGDAALQRLQSFAAERQLSLLVAAQHTVEIEGLSKKAKHGLLMLSTLLRKYNELKNEVSASELSRSLVDELGILRSFKEEGTVEALSRWENVQELLSAISEFTSEHENAALEDFLQEVSLVSAVDDLDGNRNAVTLMTLHSAKGLEYPVVFIAGLEEGLLPLYSTVLERKELEEERRLCYVGITRAMQKLYLTHARTRYRFGDVSYQSPSRFLEEIPKECIEIVESKIFYPSRAYTGVPKQVNTRIKRSNDAEYHTDVMPDYDSKECVVNGVKVGMMVEHVVFGRGKVLSLAGSGDSLKAVVEFTLVGRKNLLLKYAKLNII